MKLTRVNITCFPRLDSPSLHALTLRLKRKRRINNTANAIFQFLTVGMFPHRRLELVETEHDRKSVDVLVKEILRPTAGDHDA